jgi:UDP-glucose 4-epimerase
MRVVVIGASGNIGTSLLQALVADPEVSEVIAVARRAAPPAPKIEWRERDVTTDDLRPDLEHADAVVCLHWAIQPSRDLETLRAINVDGNRRAFEAAAAAGVPALLYSSSVGAYSRGPKDRAVDESWPRDGVPTSYYARHKAEVERRLDRFEAENPDVRVVRIRPALVFKKEAAQGIRRLFGGPFVPTILARPSLIKLLPEMEDLRGQVVHSHDVGDAFRLALVKDVRGAFNVAAEPVLDTQEAGRILNARPLPVSTRAARAGVELSWRLRLQPITPGWLDMALNVPVMDTARARTELGWTPQRSADDALLDLLEGLRTGADFPTPPLARETSGPFRIREILTGMGGREP